jgi:hypothetical protein
MRGIANASETPKPHRLQTTGTGYPYAGKADDRRADDA